MALMTRQEYIESLRKLKPRVFIAGKKVESVPDEHMFRTSINQLAVGYDFNHNPQYRDAARTVSPLIGEEVSHLWTNIQKSKEDAYANVRLTRLFTQRYICMHCASNMLTMVWAMTDEIDRDRGTSYHKRFVEFAKHMQKNDLRPAWAMMDVKGDRSLPPARQADPNLHLRIVDKKPDGVVVSGAKAHTTGGPCMHELLVVPCRALREDESDYAISFAIPIDTPGVTFICRPGPAPREAKDIEQPLSSELGLVEAITIFDDVFVPWERVFLCGEWQLAARLPGLFAGIHRRSKCACQAGRTDLLIGAAALIAKYNGLEKIAHIREKITDMMVTAESAFGCGMGAVAEGKLHPSGVLVPDAAIANAGLYQARTRFAESISSLYDIAGGIVVTMPTEADYKNPATHFYLDRYLKGKAEIPAEHRLRALELTHDLVASRLAAWMMGSTICAAGTPQTNRVELYRQFNLGSRRQLARALAKIEKE